ncbi:MAG: hypothetical protein E4H18_04940, partial [Hyphomicrobiales bacterium]
MNLREYDAAGEPALSDHKRGLEWRMTHMQGDQAFERGSRVQEVQLGGPSPFRRLMLTSMASISYPGSQAEQLLLAPQELRTPDPSFATEV